MKTYEELAKMRDNNITNIDQLSSVTQVTSTVSPCFQAANDIIEKQKRKPESNKSKKPGRPKLPILTTEEIILEEYKKLEMSYNLLELEYKILKKELEIALNENELMKLKEIRNNINNHTQNK